MALNAKKVKSSGGGNGTPAQKPIEAGTYPVRVVQVLDLGVQEQMPFQGKPKPPAQMLMMSYEFTDEFCKDDKGEDIADKPRWLSEDFVLNNLNAGKAKSTQRYNAIDPQDVGDGDFTRLIGMPCLITVVQSPRGDKIYNNVHSASTVRPKDAERMPELVNPPKVFLLDDPDMEVFLSLPEWVQERIKKNLHFNGSKLQKLLAGGKQEKKQPEPANDADQESSEEQADDKW